MKYGIIIKFDIVGGIIVAVGIKYTILYYIVYMKSAYGCRTLFTKIGLYF